VKDTLRIFITGVGGQGTITASKILGQAALAAGLGTVVGEIHGMAQRGGVVETSLSIGEGQGPLIADGAADVILGFEPVEAVRALRKASPDCTVILSTSPIVPFTVSAVAGEYPGGEECLEVIERTASRIHAFDGEALAVEAGSSFSLNVVMLGALSAVDLLPFSREILLDEVLRYTPARYSETNRKAFELGGRAVAQEPDRT